MAVIALLFAGAPATAAVLKWKPYRPITKNQSAAPARVTMTAPVGPQSLNQVRQASAKTAPKAAEPELAVEENSALADPFEDNVRAVQAIGEPVEDVFPESPAAPAETAPEIGDASDEPAPLEPADDYFPEERVPQIDRDPQIDREEPAPQTEREEPGELPDPLTAPDFGTPSLSDELRDFDRPAPTDCKAEKADCADALEKLKSNTLANIDLNINVSGVEGQDFPCECAFGVGETFEGRNWKCVTYTWKASGLCHKPLYFEQPAVERYGHSAPTLVQDVLSGAHFFASIPALPYMMGLCPPDECEYSLGYYRPGNCAPYLIDPIPLSLRAGLFQAGAIAGGILIIP